MPTLRELADVGQAAWLDYLDRQLIESGQLQAWVAQGLSGVTVNPTILDKAIGRADYDEEIRRMALRGFSTQEILDELLVMDIGRTADLLLPIFQATGGADGYVSLELDPRLAHDTEGTIAGARRLVAMLNHANLMVKVPATPEGIPAIKTLTSEGINVNITLIFAQKQYQEVVEAYLAGLEMRRANGNGLSTIASVASFFVSRIDSKVDKALQEIDNTGLQGKIAIACAKVAYAYFLEAFSSPRWEELAAHGARVQRPLWASTSTKNPSYPDLLYVDNLIGPSTVNTMPLDTLKAFLDHGQVEIKLMQGISEARKLLAKLAQTRISLAQIDEELLREGVEQFTNSWLHMLDNIDERRRNALQRAA